MISPEQTGVRIVLPPEVPHDTRICIEELVDMEIDQLKDDEKKGKQPGNGTQEPVNKQPRIGTPEPVEMKEKCKVRVSTFDTQNLRKATDRLGSKKRPSRKRMLEVVLSRTKNAAGRADAQ